MAREPSGVERIRGHAQGQLSQARRALAAVIARIDALTTELADAQADLAGWTETVDAWAAVVTSHGGSPDPDPQPQGGPPA
jgi:hypothetical protein